jgi:putative transposase
VVGIDKRTLQRWRKIGLKDRRKGSHTTVIRKLEPEKRQEIISVCNKPEYRDFSPHKVVPMLLDNNKYYGSVRTFYRILKSIDQVRPAKRRKQSRPPERTATRSNQVWCWDVTWLPALIKGLFFYAYMIIDIFDKCIVGWAVYEEEKDEHSEELFKSILCGRKIKFSYLHSDNGSIMKGVTLMALLSELKVNVSFSRPRTSNDNPYIESFFKTLKYDPKYPLRFRDINHAREWMANFVNWYNNAHLHSSVDYVTPAQMRSGEAKMIFTKRNAVMAEAKKLYPERWGKRNMKIWGAPEKVVLNPEIKQ